MSASRMASALAVLVGLSGPVWGQTPSLGIWLEPSLDLTEAGVRTKALVFPIRQVVVPLFLGGETLFASKGLLFQQMQAYRGPKDAVGQLLSEAKARGIAVWGYVDCLQWTRPGTEAARDLLEKDKTLAERNLEGGCGPPEGGKYASPFHRRVRQALRELVEEIGARYAGLEGIVLQCRLPLGTTLGFSEPTRARYIRAKQIDPIDILRGGGVANQELGLEWFDWRLAQMASLVKELGTAFKKKHSRGRVAALGYANWYRLTMGPRDNSLEDWLGWAAAKSVDELILEARWDQADNQDAWPYARALIDKAARSIPASVVASLREGEELIPMAEAQKAWSKPVPEIVWLRIGRSEDWARVAEYRQDLPSTPPVAWKLEKDGKLQGKLTLQLVSPRARDVLVHLAKAADLKFTASPNISASQPAFGSVQWINQPVWKAMEELAASPIVQGHWEKTAEGYHLVGTVGNVPPEEEVAPAGAAESWGWWPFAGAAMVAAIAALLVYVRSRRHA